MGDELTGEIAAQMVEASEQSSAQSNAGSAAPTEATSDSAAKTADATECPSVFDTYALVYAFTLMFLVPGSLALANLPFRTYTLGYVSLVTVPFVLGIVVAFATDSCDPLRTLIKRVLILTPLVVVTGVTVMFLAVMLMVPINMFLGPAYRELMTPLAGIALLAVASPLALGVIRRLRMRLTLRGALQTAALVLALMAAGYVFYLSVFQVGELGLIAKSARKDIVIYIVGALVWYLPSFGLAAGLWRRLGLV